MIDDAIILRRCSTCLWVWPLATHFKRYREVHYYKKCNFCIKSSYIKKTRLERGHVEKITVSTLRAYFGTQTCSVCRTQCPMRTYYTARCNRCDKEKVTAYTNTKIGKKKRSEWLNRNRKHHRLTKRKSNALREARKIGVYSIKVDPKEIWERDGGVCGICNQPADLNDWHLDHIIPLSKGGPHHPMNTQVAHPRCNLKKHASMPAPEIIRDILIACELDEIPKELERILV